jgi:hypothetical protein
VIISPSNTYDEFSETTTRKTDAEGSVKVIKPRGAASLVLPLSPILYLLDAISVPSQTRLFW